MVTTKATVPEGGSTSSNTPPVAAMSQQQSAAKQRVAGATSEAASHSGEAKTLQGEKPVDTMQVAALARVASALATGGGGLQAAVSAKDTLLRTHCSG